MKSLHVKAHPYESDNECIDFTFVKDGDDLIVFKGEEKEIDGRVLMLTPNNNITHIDYNGVKIYFNRYVIADEDCEEIAKSVIGFLTFYYK